MNVQVSDVNTCPLLLPDECLTDKEIVEMIIYDQNDEAKNDKKMQVCLKVRHSRCNSRF